MFKSYHQGQKEVFPYWQSAKTPKNEFLSRGRFLAKLTWPGENAAQSNYDGQYENSVEIFAGYSDQDFGDEKSRNEQVAFEIFQIADTLVKQL